MPGVPVLEEVVGQHGEERRRERHGHAVGNVVGEEPLEDLKERQVGAGDGLVEPVLLHHGRIFRVTDEGQVRVQDEREVTLGHGRQSSTFG